MAKEQHPGPTLVELFAGWRAEPMSREITFSADSAKIELHDLVGLANKFRLEISFRYRMFTNDVESFEISEGTGYKVAIIGKLVVRADNADEANAWVRDLANLQYYDVQCTLDGHDKVLTLCNVVPSAIGDRYIANGVVVVDGLSLSFERLKCEPYDETKHNPRLEPKKGDKHADSRLG